jgi:hypothetical protein
MPYHDRDSFITGYFLYFCGFLQVDTSLLQCMFYKLPHMVFRRIRKKRIIFWIYENRTHVRLKFRLRVRLRFARHSVRIIIFCIVGVTYAKMRR